MDKEHNYPFILVSGMFSFGEEEGLSKVFPYFGFWKTDVRKLFNGMGVECYNPSSGPFSSAWDKACEVYAALFGKTVDYGKAHSEKYGHERYGRTYEKALLPDWGKIDSEGNTKKVNLFGYSFGAPTERTLANLLYYGSEEERAVTPEDELSDLFKGGHTDWIHSIVSASGTNNGTSFIYALEALKLLNFAETAVYGMGSFISHTPISKVYDFRLDHFGVTKAPSAKNLDFKINAKNVKKLVHNEDNMFYDLYPHRAKELNEQLDIFDNIYYISYSGCSTKEVLGVDMPSKYTWKFPIFFASGLATGLYRSKRSDNGRIPIDKSWGASDGVCNVKSSQYPMSDPYRFTTLNDEIKPGIWNVMPVEYTKTHMSYTGMGENNLNYMNFFIDIYNRVSSLKTIDSAKVLEYTVPSFETTDSPELLEKSIG